MDSKRSLPDMKPTLLACLFALTLARGVPAGRCDAVRGAVIRTVTASLDSPCTVAGAVRSDTGCIHPLQSYFARTDTSEYRHWDSSDCARAKTALLTFRHFSGISSQPNQKLLASHSAYLTLLRKPPEQKQAPWIVRKLSELWIIFKENVLAPLFASVREPLSKLNPVWRIIVLILVAFGVLAIVVFSTKFLARFYPESDYRQDTGHAGATRATPAEWLNRAHNAASGKNYPQSVDFLYRWLVSFMSTRGIVRRHEWWTNRQFLSLIRHRSPGRVSVAEGIVRLYEDTFYGHRSPSEQAITSLLSETPTKGSSA